MGRSMHSAMATVPQGPEKATHEIDYVRWLQQMQTDLAETLGGIMLRGARPVQIGTADGATVRASTSPGRLVGWSLRVPAFSADPGVVRLRDGQDANGAVLAVVNVAAGKSETVWLAPGGISFQYGLYVEIFSGTGLASVEGAVYLGAAE
ncbi:hypothetical protein [Streptomyces griseoaurantiacus]|uniref:hypothetical protein n=1 Tax=Streptomyces griseoaurantiacus TaxID=68213 RepID=UPI0030E23AAF